MTTDTSEKGIESLICTWLTGVPYGSVKYHATGDLRPVYSVGWSHSDPHDYDREYCVDIAQLSQFLHATQPEVAAAPQPGQRHHPAQVPGPPARGDQQAGHHRRPAQRHQARPAPDRPVLWRAVAGQRLGQTALRPEPLHRNPPAALQQRQRPACPGPVPLHQRPAHPHLRA